MRNMKLEVILPMISNESQAPRGQDIFYKCGKCGDIVPSQPKDNIGCKCGNVFIDTDYVRLAVEDLSQFQVMRRLK